MNNSITPAQLTKLQTLWSHWWKLHGDTIPVVFAFRNDAERSRAERLVWLSKCLSRRIESSKQLSRDEAEQAIKGLASALPEHLNTKKRLSRRDAHDLAKDGRRDNAVPVLDQIVSAKEIQHINNLLSELGWSWARLVVWLQSPSGSLRGRSVIRTRGDANKVRWGLKGILKKISVVAIR